MKLQKIVSRLQELHPKEIDLSLDRIQNLCQRLGNPQDKLKAISIVGTDRKSTRLNSSHDQISYAVFCLKKKNQILDIHQYFYKALTVSPHD